MKEINKISRYLSFLLRHQPDSIGLTLDAAGWANIKELVDKTVSFDLNLEVIKLVVATNEKQRFAISEDGKRIRANQGHSINIDLALSPQVPPKTLLHGSATQFLASIYEYGLVKGRRQHVHLSSCEKVAKAVGERHGKPVLFIVDSEKMHLDGYKFYKSVNNVWLVEHVPVKYLTPFYTVPKTT